MSKNEVAFRVEGTLFFHEKKRVGAGASPPGAHSVTHFAEDGVQSTSSSLLK